MNQFLSSFRAGGRAAIVALALGATAAGVLPAPAMAHSPSKQFQIDLGSGSAHFRAGRRDRDRDRDHDYFWDGRGHRYCVSDRGFSRALRQGGWRNIEFVREHRRNRVDIVARKGRFHYLLRADRCDGEVRVVKRLRHGRGFN